MEYISSLHIAKQLKEDNSSQLYDLSTNEILKPTFPNLRTLANVCMSHTWDSISGENLFKNENDKNSIVKQIL